MFFAEANIAHFGPMFHMPPLLLTLFLSSFFILSSSILLAHLTRRGVWSRSAAVIRSGWLLFEMTFLFGSFSALFVSSTNWKVVQDRSWYEERIIVINIGWRIAQKFLIFYKSENRNAILPTALLLLKSLSWMLLFSSFATSLLIFCFCAYKSSALNFSSGLIIGKCFRIVETLVKNKGVEPASSRIMRKYSLKNKIHSYELMQNYRRIKCNVL